MNGTHSQGGACQNAGILENDIIRTWNGKLTARSIEPNSGVCFYLLVGSEKKAQVIRRLTSKQMKSPPCISDPQVISIYEQFFAFLFCIQFLARIGRREELLEADKVYWAKFSQKGPNIMRCCNGPERSRTRMTSCGPHRCAVQGPGHRQQHCSPRPPSPSPRMNDELGIIGALAQSIFTHPVSQGICTFWPLRGDERDLPRFMPETRVYPPHGGLTCAPNRIPLNVEVQREGVRGLLTFEVPLLIFLILSPPPKRILNPWNIP